MAENVGSINYDVRLDSSKLKSDAGDVDNTVKSLGDKISNSFKSAEAGSKVLLAAVAAVGAAAVMFGKQSVDAYFAAEQAQTKLRTNLLNVKGATDENVASLSRLASELQNVGVIEDDVIKAGMSQLATFNLQGKTIEKLTPKITDMVAQLKGHNATAEDMVAINNLVGKVMTGNVGALSRYGVTLDENQKKVLQNGTESEKAAKLVEVLGQNYGEVNKALRNTPQGQITALKNSFGDLQEGLGELIVKGLAPLLKGFSDWVGRVGVAGGFVAYFTKLIKDNEQKLYMLGGAILVGLVPAIVALAVAFWGLMAPLLPFLAVGAALGAVAFLIKNNWEKVAPVFNYLKGIFDKVRTAFQMVIDISKGWDPGALMTEQQFAPWKGFVGVITRVKEVIDTLRTAFQMTIDIFRGWDPGALMTAEQFAPWQGFVNVITRVKDVALQAWDSFKIFLGWLQSVGVGYINFLKLAWDAIGPSIMTLVSTVMTRLMPTLGNIFSSIMQLWNAINPGFMTVLKFLAIFIGAALVGAIWVAINVLNIIISVIGWVINVIANVISWISNWINKMGQLAGMAGNVIGAIIGFWSRLPGAVSNIIGDVVHWFSRLPGMILNAVGNMGNILYDAGRNIINGLVRGIQDSFGSVKDTLGNLTDKMTSWKGPPARDKVLLTDNAKLIMGSLLKGFESSYPAIQSSLGDFTNTLGGATISSPHLGFNTPTFSDNEAVANNSVNVTVNLTGIMSRSKSDEREIAKSLVRSINEELKAKNVPILGGGSI